MCAKHVHIITKQTHFITIELSEIKKQHIKKEENEQMSGYKLTLTPPHPLNAS